MISKRDVLRGVVTDLQKMTGVKAFKIRELNSQDDCYKAIYEVVKADVSKTEDNKIQTYKKTLKALHEVNCEVNQDRENLKKEIEKLKEQKKELKRRVIQDFEDIRKECCENIDKAWAEAKKLMDKNQLDLQNVEKENIKLKNKNRLLTISWWIMLIITVMNVGVKVWNLFF